VPPSELDRAHDVLRGELHVRPRGERARHRFVAVEHDVRAPAADLRQRPVVVDDHHVAAEHEVGFARGDAHGVDVFGLVRDADVRGDRAALLRQARLVEDARALAFEMPGHAEQRAHDYVRHGTTTLFAALEIATGKVTGLCKQRHRHQEFLAFLKHLARAYPDRELHLVMDNYATHERAEVRDWLAANPRIHIHFTPTSGSWLNLVEVWFGIIERQAIRRGSFPSVRDLMIKIRSFITGWNQRCHPFIWTKQADEILDKIKRKRSRTTSH